MKKVGNFLIGRDHERRMNSREIKVVDETYQDLKQQGKRLVLGTLSARSGTKWLCDVFELHDNATGITERNATVEAFFRYITYNNLPIDTTGHIQLFKQGIIEDWQRGDISLVYSPYFSHAVDLLDKELEPEKIIIAINDPRITVQSMLNKDMFKHHYVYEQYDKTIGYQPNLGESWGFMFGRIMPKGDFFKTWNQLTQIGKISWWANMITMDIYEQVKDYPEEKIFYFHLKEASKNYSYYRKVAEMFSLRPIISEKDFMLSNKNAVKKWHNKVSNWNEQEMKEFEHYTREWHELYKELYNL